MDACVGEAPVFFCPLHVEVVEDGADFFLVGGIFVCDVGRKVLNRSVGKEARLAYDAAGGGDFRDFQVNDCSKLFKNGDCRLVLADAAACREPSACKVSRKYSQAFSSAAIKASFPCDL